MEELRKHIQHLREDFIKGSLDESEVNADPSEQFRLWMQQAVEAQVPEVQAMNLATVSSSGTPSSRIVYLREFGNNEFCFYTNYQSRKARELEQNDQAALTFFWPQLERQIRIEGCIKRAPEMQSDAYFNLRPYESKIGAWASAQSKELNSREALEKKIEQLKQTFPEEKIKRPDHWGGLVLQAKYYEFWQGRKSRLHDRLAYKQGNNNKWKLVRLSP